MSSVYNWLKNNKKIIKIFLMSLAIQRDVMV